MPVASGRCADTPPSFGFIACSNKLPPGDFSGLKLSMLRYPHLRSSMTLPTLPDAYRSEVGSIKHYTECEFINLVLNQFAPHRITTLCVRAALHTPDGGDSLVVTAVANEVLRIGVDGAMSVNGEPLIEAAVTPDPDVPALCDDDGDWVSFKSSVDNDAVLEQSMGLKVVVSMKRGRGHFGYYRFGSSRTGAT